MTLERIGWPNHPNHGAAFGADPWPESSGKGIDLSAPYAAWFDSFMSGPLFRVSDAPPPAANAVQACLLQEFTSGLAVTSHRVRW
jgi:hypothetical protein